MSLPELSELTELEHRGWRSLCDGTGAEVYGELLTADGVMVLAHGQALDRDAVVASLRDAPPWREYAIEDARLVPLGPDAAALVYRGSASRDGAGPFTAWMTSVYVRRGDAWALAVYQQTPVPGPG